MPTAYVYAPITGTITGRDNYCDCADGDPCQGSDDPHARCKNWSSPIDMGNGNTGAIFLYVNYPTVKSIRTRIEYECCNNASGNFDRTITVELYGQNNAVCYIGAVMFGHVASPTVTHNMLYNLTSSSKQLGSIPAFSQTFAWCYSGPHIHMERSNGQSVAPCCCSGTTAGSTQIYKWVFSNCPTLVEP